jgi:hypothetical protein
MSFYSVISVGKCFPIRNVVLWIMTAFSPVGGFQRLKVTYCPVFLGSGVFRDMDTVRYPVKLQFEFSQNKKLLSHPMPYHCEFQRPGLIGPLSPLNRSSVTIK